MVGAEAIGSSSDGEHAGSSMDRTRQSSVELTGVGNRWETGRIEAFSDGY